MKSSSSTRVVLFAVLAVNLEMAMEDLHLRECLMNNNMLLRFRVTQQTIFRF